MPTTGAPRCDLYSLDVQDALAIDEPYDMLQVWFDRWCPVPTMFLPPPIDLPANKKVEAITRVRM